MKQRLTYRHFLLLGGILLLLAGIGLFSLANSFLSEYNTYQLLRNRGKSIDQADAILRDQSLQQKRLKLQLRSMQSDRINLSGHLDLVQYLEKLSQENQLRILALPQELLEAVSGYTLLTERFRLEGKLHDLLRAIYQLEQSDRVGSIVACSFSLERILLQGKPQSMLVADLTLKRINRE